MLVNTRVELRFFIIKPIAEHINNDQLHLLTTLVPTCTRKSPISIIGAMYNPWNEDFVKHSNKMFHKFLP